MSLAQAVDVHANDRGLLSCLQAASVHENVIKYLQDTIKIVTLEDFIHVVSQADYEKELAEIVAQTSFATKVADQLVPDKLQVARLRAAYRAGVEALKIADQPASNEPDMPVAPQAVAELEREWRTVYGTHLVFDVHLTPADALLARYHREFRRKSATCIPLGKMKSTLADKKPKDDRVISLGAEVRIQLDQKDDVVISSVIDAYFALRVNSNAWAYAGNFMTESAVESGKKVRFFSFQEALDYADFAMRMTMQYGAGSRTWMIERDHLTRGKVATLMRRGFPGTEALKQALMETYLDWRTPNSRVSSPPKSSQPSESSGQRRGTRRGRSRSPKVPNRELPEEERAKIQTVSTLPGGIKLCKAFNDKRGCNNKRCEDAHRCDIRMPNGKGCGGQHPRARHNFEKDRKA